MAVYGYIRLNEDIYNISEKEADDQQTADTLKQCILSYVNEHSWYLNHMFIEDMVIKKTLEMDRRDEGARLLNLVRHDDIIIVNDLVQVFASPTDASNTVELLRCKGVHLHVVEFAGDITEGILAGIFKAMLNSFKRWDKARVSERIKVVKQEQKSKGRFLGGARPFGFMIHENGKLIEHPVEQKALKRILELSKRGKSLRAISREVSTPVMPISFKTVQRILQRQKKEVSGGGIE